MGTEALTSDSQQQGAAKRRYTCPGCAANLLFEPQDGCLTCPYCGRKETIPESAEEIQERWLVRDLNKVKPDPELSKNLVGLRER